MRLNEKIKTVLSNILPVSYADYSGAEESYINFFFLPQNGFGSDDGEQFTTHYIQIDVFTPHDPKPYADQVKIAMKQAGFKKNFEHEFYDDAAKSFQYILRFYIIEEES